jgi:hypothetical protein
MEPLGVIFLHGGVAVKIRLLTHLRGVISGENHDSAIPDWRWRRLRHCFFVESIALETIHGTYAIGAELVFAVAQGLSLQGICSFSWCYRDGVFLKTGQVLPLLADSRCSRADGTLARVVLVKWLFSGRSRGWSPFGSCWAWHVLVVVVVAVVVANLLISGGGRKALQPFFSIVLLFKFNTMTRSGFSKKMGGVGSWYLGLGPAWMPVF